MIHRRGTILQEYLVKSDLENGIKIDIFVIENTYNNPLRRFWHGFRSEAGLFALSCLRMYLWREEFRELAKGNKKAVLAVRIKGCIGRLFAGRGTHWYEKVQRCLMECRDEQSVYVTIPSGRGHFWGELYRREPFLELVEAEFEDMRLPVTADYDNYLRNLYGDYRSLPPESAREHHVIYRIQL
jgi:lipopolysaccharide cholinephosphotransferase